MAERDRGRTTLQFDAEDRSILDWLAIRLAPPGARPLTLLEVVRVSIRRTIRDEQRVAQKS